MIGRIGGYFPDGRVSVEMVKALNRAATARERLYRTLMVNCERAPYRDMPQTMPVVLKNDDGLPYALGIPLQVPA